MNRREVQPAVLAIVGKWSRLYQRPLQQSRRRSEATRAKIMCPRPAFSRVGRTRTSRLKGTSEGIPEHHPLNYILLSLCLSLSMCIESLCILRAQHSASRPAPLLLGSLSSNLWLLSPAPARAKPSLTVAYLPSRGWCSKAKTRRWRRREWDKTRERERRRKWDQMKMACLPFSDDCANRCR